MNNLYQQTIKTIFLGLISVFLIVSFAGCTDGDLGDSGDNLPKGGSDNTNSDTNKNTDNNTKNNTVNHCLPGQTPGKDC